MEDIKKQYTTHITARTGWFDIDLKELWRYRDLAWLFFKRNYTTLYKQSILGPLWLILNPLLSVALYALVFGRLAGLSEEGVPQFAFYLCSNALWAFFSTSLTQVAHTFTANASIMGKVYFPRLVMPVSSVISGGLDLAIQLAMLAVTMGIYAAAGTRFGMGPQVLAAPLIVLQVGILALGFGIIIAACTTRYRDLAVLVGFGVQLWMYATPVVYTASLVPEKYLGIYMLNPMAPVMECWRSAVLGSGEFLWSRWGASWVTTSVVLVLGVVLFSHVEKTFMDTV